MSNIYWADGEYIPKEQAKISPLTHTLHYGLGAFEGVRSYQSHDGKKSLIFRLVDHTKRLLESAKIIGVDVDYSLDQLIEAQIEVVKRSKLTNSYIRPLVYIGSERLGLDIIDIDRHVMISCIEWPNYFGSDAQEKGIEVMISSFTRQFPNSLMTKSKISGGYVNGIMAHDLARKNGFQEAILLDTNGFIAEGSGQNIFLVKDGELLTPSLNCCLNGITRRTVMEFAKDNNIPVKERNITRDEICVADEVFLCGTASEIAPVKGVDKIKIGNGKRGDVTKLIQKLYLDTVSGKLEQYQSWLTSVE